jgi:hypothetical protein
MEDSLLEPLLQFPQSLPLLLPPQLLIPPRRPNLLLRIPLPLIPLLRPPLRPPLPIQQTQPIQIMWVKVRQLRQ